MRTRFQSRHNSPQQEALPVIVEPLRIELPFLEDQFQKDPPLEVPMADNRTMAELLQAPTKGYEDAIVILEIAANNFELKHECLKIIESKSKVRQSRAKVGTSSFTLAVSSEVAELKDMVRALLLDKKNQSSTLVSSPASVKAVEPNCVTCGGAHSYQNCPATSENVYRDNIQKYVSQAVAANYNQGNTGFRPQMVANQIRPPGFPPYQNHQNNFNRGNNFSQNRGGNFNQSNFNHGGNFNQGQLHRPQVNQPPAYQASTYQAPIPQTQSVSQTDFESYVKANDAVLRNMQNQGSGTLPSNTIANLKEELKGPKNFDPSKVVKQGTEVTKDQVQTPSSPSTAPVQPPVSQSKTPTLISKPVVAPVSAPMPNVKSFIPYPSRRDDERCHDQANEQIEKFYEIFKDISIKISYTDALIIMPKFASTLKALIENKEKLSEMARTPMNEHCSAVILNKLPRKLRDPGKFLISCEFPGMELTSTCMTLELADRSVSKPIGVAKDVSFKIGRALIDVHKGELTLRIGNEAITYNLDQTVRHSANYNQMTANKIDVICEEYSQKVLSFFDTTTSGNLTPHDDPIVSTTSHTLTPFGDSDFLLFEEADAFLGLEDDLDSSKINPLYYDPKGGILLLENILNSEPLPPLPNHEQYLPSYKKELKVCEAKTVNPPLMNLLSPWVSPVYCVPKKGGFTIVENKENELIPTRLVTGWRTLKKKLTETPILIAPNWDLPFELMCDASDFAIENLAADHLSRLENPYENVLDPKEINETFPLETLSMVTFRGDSSAPWFADFANYHASNFIVK
nr:hypothetical protein [Tanacetum cinerariifolium]